MAAPTELLTYLFDSTEGDRLLVRAIPASGKVSSFEFERARDGRFMGSRSGRYDNQGSSKPWTWAWTTDSGDFEVWRQSGLQLRMTAELIQLFRRSLFGRKASHLQRHDVRAIELGKTGYLSVGLIAVGQDGRKYPLLKDSLPVLDEMHNVTYDGICELQDLFPLREIAAKITGILKVPFQDLLDKPTRGAK